MNISERARVHTRRQIRARGLEELYQRFVDVLFAHNPVGLPKTPGTRQDYGSPVGTLILKLGRAYSAQDLACLLYLEMIDWYGKDTGSEELYQVIAQELWSISTQFSSDSVNSK